MKKLCLFLVLVTTSFGCEGETVQSPDDNPCGDWQIQVSTSQQIRLVDSNGLRKQDIEPYKLSVISTDVNWNPLFTEDGIPIKDLGNIIGVSPVFDSEGNIDYLLVGLGQVNIERRCYFLLYVNETEYHKIIADYNIDCGGMILTKFQYNSTEYTANDWEIIDIVVD